MAIAALEPIYQQIPEATTTGSTESKDDLGMNQFLTMLVAQLKNQDPLNPMEGTDFTAQLAQFSGLEQQFAMNENLVSIQEALSGKENDGIIDYIGKTVKVNDDMIVAKDGQVDSGIYTLEDRAEVTIYIYDDEGLEVRRIYNGWQDAGEYDLEWDGNNNSGDAVTDGTYTFEVQAKDPEGLFVSYNSYVTGEVTGVTYNKGIAYLMVGDWVVAPSNVVEVTKTETSG
jgi:flagellar basal-body rod modification protein FlgD